VKLIVCFGCNNIPKVKFSGEFFPDFLFWLANLTLIAKLKKEPDIFFAADLTFHKNRHPTGINIQF
jgi:hypothetical protein